MKTRTARAGRYAAPTETEHRIADTRREETTTSKRRVFVGV